MIEPAILENPLVNVTLISPITSFSWGYPQSANGQPCSNMTTPKICWATLVNFTHEWIHWGTPEEINCQTFSLTLTELLVLSADNLRRGQTPQFRNCTKLLLLNFSMDKNKRGSHLTFLYYANELMKVSTTTGFNLTTKPLN